MLLIDAVYIHESGGKVLLEYLVAELKKKDCSFYLLLDNRLESKVANIIADTSFLFVAPGERSRKTFYRKLPGEIDTVFCFANVPPPIRLHNIRVFVFMQNVLLLANYGDRNLYPVGSKIKFLLKKFYIRFLNKATYQWVVQTPSMQAKLQSAIGVLPTQIHVIPFFPELSNHVSYGKHDNSKFIYVADGVPQKNHGTLLDAWLILKEKYQLIPELHLTVPDKYTVITNRIDALAEKGVCIINHGICTPSDLGTLYAECGYLIFPSLAESFGLPLLESAMAGCGILASDLPFVYDVVKPMKVFEPLDAEAMTTIVRESMHKVPESTVVITNECDKLLDLLSQ